MYFAPENRNSINAPAIRALRRQMNGYPWRSPKWLLPRRERSVSLTVFLWFSMAIVLGGLTAQKGGDSREVLPRSNMTAAKEIFGEDLSPAKRPSSLVETSVPLRKPSSIALSMSASYDQRPLVFEANQGQTDSRVKFFSRGTGYGVFFTPHEVVVVLHSAPSEGLRANKLQGRSVKEAAMLEAAGRNAQFSSPGVASNEERSE